MKWSDMRIGNKIRVGFFCVTGIFLLVLVTTAREVGDVEHHTRSAVQKYDLSMSLLQREIDHLKWAQSLGQFVHDHKATELSISSDARKCAFGRWFYSDERITLENVSPELKPLLVAIEEPHIKLHESAGTIQKLKKEGRQEASEEVYNTETFKALGLVQQNLQAMREKVKSGIETDRTALFADIDFMKLLIYVSTVVSVGLAIVLSFSCLMPSQGR